MTKLQSTTDFKQLKIMQVVPALKVGGVERGTIEFAQYLKQLGHLPVVVSSGGHLVQELTQANITHIELNVNKKSMTSLLSVGKLRHLLLDLKIDVVHARSRIPAWLCYFALKKINSNKPKFITTLHGLHSVNKYSAIMARADQVIAVSAAAKNYLNDNYAEYLQHEPIVINRGIDESFVYGHKTDEAWQRKILQQWPNLNQGKKVLLPGRLSRVKGIENLLPWLKATDQSNKLLLTASPNESKYSRHIAGLLKQHDLAEKVVWLGIQRQMPDLYAFADLVVSVNNKPESFGRTVLEALSIGKSVVAFDCGGVSEIMQNLYPAGCVGFGNTTELTARIELFLIDSPVVKPHDKYENLKMFSDTLKVYTELLHG